MPSHRSINMVEIAMGLVILAIVSTTAIPSFIDQHPDNQRAAVAGVAGSLGSASAINYAVRSISTENGISISNCSDVAQALEGNLGSQYLIQALPVSSGNKVECVVSTSSGDSATFIAHGIS